MQRWVKIWVCRFSCGPGRICMQVQYRNHYSRFMHSPTLARLMISEKRHLIVIYLELGKHVGSSDQEPFVLIVLKSSFLPILAVIFARVQKFLQPHRSKT